MQWRRFRLVPNVCGREDPGLRDIAWARYYGQAGVFGLDRGGKQRAAGADTWSGKRKGRRWATGTTVSERSVFDVIRVDGLRKRLFEGVSLG
jgi:hypothetical protein